MMEQLDIHNDKYSITRVSIILNCSPATIKRWYKWASMTNELWEDIGLPIYSRDTRGTWYFTNEQVKQLINFKKNLKWGQMANFNSKYYWSKKKGDTNGN